MGGKYTQKTSDGDKLTAALAGIFGKKRGISVLFFANHEWGSRKHIPLTILRPGRQSYHRQFIWPTGKAARWRKKTIAMKKKYLMAALVLLVAVFTFSGCYVQRYPRYHHYHHPHTYHRY